MHRSAKRSDRNASAERLPDAVDAGDGEHRAHHEQEKAWTHILGEDRTKWRGHHAAYEQTDGGRGKGLEPHGEDEGDRDRHGQEEFGRADRPDRLARLSALNEKVGGHHRSPSAATRSVEKAARRPQRRDDARVLELWRG